MSADTTVYVGSIVEINLLDTDSTPVRWLARVCETIIDEGEAEDELKAKSAALAAVETLLQSTLSELDRCIEQVKKHTCASE